MYQNYFVWCDHSTLNKRDERKSKLQSRLFSCTSNQAGAMPPLVRHEPSLRTTAALVCPRDPQRHAGSAHASTRRSESRATSLPTFRRELVPPPPPPPARIKMERRAPRRRQAGAGGTGTAILGGARSRFSERSACTSTESWFARARRRCARARTCAWSPLAARARENVCNLRGGS